MTITKRHNDRGMAVDVTVETGTVMVEVERLSELVVKTTIRYRRAGGTEWEFLASHTVREPSHPQDHQQDHQQEPITR